MAPSSSHSDVFSLRDNVALYRCLGVERDVTDTELKRAWRRLAAQYHPDKNPHGEERFKECEFAYRVLSDPEQRRLYDATRLRSKINQCRDPMMDPDAELSPDALRDFISSLMTSEKEQEERRRQFERRRNDELARRERFDAAHPSFTMPELPSVDTVRAKYGCSTSMVTTAEIRAKLDSRVAEHEDALARYSSLPGCAAPCPPPGTNDSAAPRRGGSAGTRTALGHTSLPANALPEGDALDAFRRQGADCCSGSARQRALEQHRRNNGSNSARKPDNGLRFRADLSFTQSQKQYYNGDLDHIRQKARDFNYTRYVQESKANRSQLSDAILSDALEGYAGGY